MYQCEALSHILLFGELYIFQAYFWLAAQIDVLIKLLKKHTSLTRQKQYNKPVLVYCWVSILNDGSILNRHWINARVCCSPEGCAFIVCAITSYKTP